MVEQSLRKGEVRGSSPLIGSPRSHRGKYMTRGHYSRLESVEERRNIKKAYRFAFLSIVIVIILIWFGLPFMAKLSGFFTNLKSNQLPIEKTDNTPPAPPKIDEYSENTNKKVFEITGNVEEGSTVIFNFNSKDNEILADRNGIFSIKLNLVDGENSFFATAKDAAGNESQKTKIYRIVFDNEPPKIIVTSPPDGESFYGSKQQTVTIKGTCEKESSLTINERFVSIDDEGNFSFTFNLSEGENIINFKAVDKAGNESNTSIKLKFTP